MNELIKNYIYNDLYEFSGKLKYNYDGDTEFSNDSFLIRFKKEGYAGGNCWGDQAEYYSCDLDEDAVVKEIYDNILIFLNNKYNLNVSLDEENYQYLQNYRYLHEEQYDTDGDYYGNYTTYLNIIIKFDNMYEAFKDLYDNIIFS